MVARNFWPFLVGYTYSHASVLALPNGRKITKCSIGLQINPLTMTFLVLRFENCSKVKMTRDNIIYIFRFYITFMVKKFECSWWFAMAWNMWQWINTLLDFDHGVPRTLFICFIEWPCCNLEIDHRSRISATFNLIQLGVRVTFISYQRQFDVMKIYTVPKYPLSRWVWTSPYGIFRAFILQKVG